jgi:hypothetical protein
MFIAYKTGTDINIASAVFNGSVTSSDLIDDVETFITLQGVTDFTNIDSGDFIVT